MPIPEQTERKVGRFFDDLDEVYDWAAMKADEAGAAGARKREIIEKGGSSLTKAGGKIAVLQDINFEDGKKFAYEDMFDAIEEISPYRKLEDASEEEALLICTRCGLDLPRPMVPEPPKVCGYDFSVYQELTKNDPKQYEIVDERSMDCQIEAGFHIIAPHGEFFSCAQHLSQMIDLADMTKVDGRPVHVEVIR